MSRVLALGLDAADLGFIEALAARGRLPVLAGLLDRGQRTVVTNPWPYRAELPWTSFLTGRGPGDTGYWGTVGYEPATYAVSEVGALVADPFYGPDAFGGGPVIVFDVPHAVLSPQVRGLQVTAWGAHSPQYPRASRPVGLLDELDRAVGAHPAFDADSQPGWWSEPYLTSLTAALLAGARQRATAMALLLARQPDWRLAVTVFSEPHSAGHHLWHGVDPAHPLHGHPGAAAAAARLEAVYRGVDEAVGRIVAAAGEGATVVIFAVHGTRGNGGDLLALHLGPELLHRDRYGWARVRNPRRDPLAEGGWVEPTERQQAFDVVAAGLVAHRGADPSIPPDALDRAATLARRAARLARAARGPAPSPWYQVESRATPEVGFGRGPTASDRKAPSAAERPLGYLGTSLYQRYWPHQASFALPSFSDLHLRVNLAGREGRGLVPVGGRDRELDRLERLLSECRDPRSGQPVVADLTRPGAAAGGVGPPADLVVLAGAPVDALEHPRLGRIGPLPFLRTGEHGGQGWALVVRPCGPPPRIGPQVPVTDLGGILGRLAFEKAE